MPLHDDALVIGKPISAAESTLVGRLRERPSLWILCEWATPLTVGARSGIVQQVGLVVVPTEPGTDPLEYLGARILAECGSGQHVSVARSFEGSSYGYASTMERIGTIDVSAKLRPDVPIPGSLTSDRHIPALREIQLLVFPDRRAGYVYVRALRSHQEPSPIEQRDLLDVAFSGKQAALE